MIHMPDKLNGVPVPVPSIWDWSPTLIALLALAFLVLGPLVISRAGGGLPYRSAFFNEEGFTDKGHALLRDVIIVAAMYALAFITRDIDPGERTWYTSVTWHMLTLIVGLVAVFLLKRRAESKGKVLVHNPYVRSDTYLLVVFGVMASCAMAAVPAIVVEIFSKDVIGSLLVGIYVACVAGFVAFALLCRRLIDWANDEGPIRLQERAEARIEKGWARRLTH